MLDPHNTWLLKLFSNHELPLKIVSFQFECFEILSSLNDFWWLSTLGNCVLFCDLSGFFFLFLSGFCFRLLSFFFCLWLFILLLLLLRLLWLWQWWKAFSEPIDLSIELNSLCTIKRTNDSLLWITSSRKCVRSTTTARDTHVRLVIDICKERTKGIEISARIWIVFMVMALSTTNGCSQPHPRKISDSVSLIDCSVFFDLQSTLMSRLQQTVIGTGEEKVFRVFIWTGLDEITRELHLSKSIKS